MIIPNEYKDALRKHAQDALIPLGGRVARIKKDVKLFMQAVGYGWYGYRPGDEYLTLLESRTWVAERLGDRRKQTALDRLKRLEQAGLLSGEKGGAVRLHLPVNLIKTEGNDE